MWCYVLNKHYMYEGSPTYPMYLRGITKLDEGIHC